jgi:hypothetical protein
LSNSKKALINKKEILLINKEAWFVKKGVLLNRKEMLLDNEAVRSLSAIEIIFHLPIYRRLAASFIHDKAP